MRHFVIDEGFYWLHRQLLDAHSALLDVIFNISLNARPIDKRPGNVLALGDAHMFLV